MIEDILMRPAPRWFMPAFCAMWILLLAGMVLAAIYSNHERTSGPKVQTQEATER